MAAVVPPSEAGQVADHRVARWTRWSLWMLPVFLVALIVSSIVGSALLSAFGLHEGDLLLMQRGVAGWAAEIGVSLLLVTPAVVGVVLATKALRHGAGRAAWVGLVANGLLVLWTAFVFANAVRMTYFPGG